MENIENAEYMQRKVLDDLKEVFKSEYSDHRFYQKVFNEVFAHGIINNERVLYKGVATMAEQLSEYYWSKKP